jgi:DNA polymerase-3 subunit alpha
MATPVMKKNYAHLHLHTDYSMLDGKGQIASDHGKDRIGYVDRAKKLGFSHLSITDHGNIAGTYEFYMECRDAGIEPILGCEFYFVPNAAKVKDEKEGERFHVVFLARNEAGFRTIVNLSNESHKQYYYKPLIDRPLLESLEKADRKNLVVLSGCAGSIISRKALKAIRGSAEDELLWWKQQFPHFYVELQHHDTDFDRKLNRRLLKLARGHNLPWVITNDPHYVTKDECHEHDALLAIQTASDLDDPSRFRFDGDGYHLRSRKELVGAFREYGSEVWKPGLAETLRIARSCSTHIPAWDKRSWHIPKFPDVDDPERELRRLAKRSLHHRGLDSDPRYVARVRHELKEFKKVGMANFLLITRDANIEAKKRGIPVGPGRGSVCGTLVGYLIGIHKIDPIRYDLLFERFLNPERPKMPDVDTDFSAWRRDEMIQYMIDKYGAENTMRVAAFQKMKTKAAFKSLAKAFGIDFQQANALSKKIQEDAEGNVVLPKEVREGYPELHALMTALEGLKKGISRHPAGVIVFDPDDDIKQLVPEMWIASSKRFVSQYDLESAAGLGLMKQDFLALRTLDTIDECVKLVRERHGVKLSPDDWIPDTEEHDDAIYKMLRDGDCDGVFQMEGGTNRRGIVEIACERFEDIVSCTSLYRAGPLDAGADERYLKNKRDGKVRVLHESLRPYLERSWGEMIYQEQMFQILNEVAGFSWSLVDDAKTAMARKDPAKMAKLKDEAIAGFRKTGGMDRKTAEAAWDQIAAQASYLFNRSHAVAYSMLTYQTARLKYLYPLEFFAALLRTVEPKSEDAKEKRENYLGMAVRRGFKIMPPDVNVSDSRFMPNGEDELLFGLQDIKGVGPGAITKLEAEIRRRKRKAKKEGKKLKKVFRSVADVSVAVNNQGVVKALAAAGALRSLGVEPDTDKQEELLRWQFNDPCSEYRERMKKKIRLPKHDNGRVFVVGQIVKVEKRKTKNNDPFYSWVVRMAPGEQIKVTVFFNASELFKLPKGTIISVSGRWNQKFQNVSISDGEQVTILKRVKKETKAA